MVLRLTGLKNQNGVAVEDADVSLESVTYSNGDEIEDIDVPASFTHEGDGTYELNISGDVELTVGRVVKLKAVVTSGDARAELIETAVVVGRVA